MGRRKGSEEKTTDEWLSLGVPGSCFYHPDRNHLRTIHLKFLEEIGWHSRDPHEEIGGFTGFYGLTLPISLGPVCLVYMEILIPYLQIYSYRMQFFFFLLMATSVTYESSRAGD